MTRIRQHHWLISVKLEDLWVSLCPIERFDLYAGKSKPLKLDGTRVCRNAKFIMEIPGGEGLHGLRMERGLPPGFQEARVFLLPKFVFIPAWQKTTNFQQFFADFSQTNPGLRKCAEK